jgi:hypothetical protein
MISPSFSIDVASRVTEKTPPLMPTEKVRSYRASSSKLPAPDANPTPTWPILFLLSHVCGASIKFASVGDGMTNRLRVREILIELSQRASQFEGISCLGEGGTCRQLFSDSIQGAAEVVNV